MSGATVNYISGVTLNVQVAHLIKQKCSGEKLHSFFAEWPVSCKQDHRTKWHGICGIDRFKPV